MRALLVALALLISWPVQAVMTAAGTNTVAPSDDPGFANVGSNALFSTVVYIGNRWVLTVSHVGDGAPTLNGSERAVEPGSTHTIVTGLGSTGNLLLYRLVDDPGLPAIQIASVTPTVGESVTMIGNCGMCVRGAPATCTDGGGDQEGWYQASGGPTMRWGTNQIDTASSTALTTLFSKPSAPSFTTFEATGASGDSGGPWFVKRAGLWQIVGIMWTATPGCETGALVSGATTTAINVTSFRDEILLRAGLASSLMPVMAK